MNADLEPPDSELRDLPAGRLPEVEKQIQALSGLDRDELLARLRHAAREKDLVLEVLLQFVRVGHAEGDQEVYFAAFEAMVRAATPLIAARMRKLYAISDQDLEDHQNLVFEDLVERVNREDPGLEYGVRRFGSFILRRSIDAMKSRHHPWTRSIKQVLEAENWFRGGGNDPNHDSEAFLIKTGTDPRRLSSAWDPETRAEGQEELDALRQQLAHLPEKACEAFFMSRVLGRTQPEIAKHFNVTDRTIREWIGSVAEVVDQRKDT